MTEIWDQFTTLARSEFEFLENEFSFKIISSNSPYIVYESDKVRVSVFFGGQHDEVDVRFELIETQRADIKSFGVEALKAFKLKESNPQAAKSTTVSNLSDFIPVLKNLAQELKQYGTEVLSGEVTFYEKLMTSEIKARQQYEKDTRLSSDFHSKHRN